MRYEWDPAKAKTNLRDHGVAFEVMEGFDWPTAEEAIDDRFPYGEERIKAAGLIGIDVYICIYTERGSEDDPVRHVISLRKANAREVRAYLEARHA